MSEERQAVHWKGDPITYQYEKGTGLVVGKKLYIFDQEGTLQAMEPLMMSILKALLPKIYPNAGAALAGGLAGPQPGVEE